MVDCKKMAYCSNIYKKYEGCNLLPRILEVRKDALRTYRG